MVAGRHDSGEAPTDRISDEEIRELLKPRTALERSEKALPILKLIAKHGELPSTVLTLAFNDPNVVSLGHAPMLFLVREKYLVMRSGIFRGSRQHFFRITLKGRQALKDRKG